MQKICLGKFKLDGMVFLNNLKQLIKWLLSTKNRKNYKVQVAVIEIHHHPLKSNSTKIRHRLINIKTKF